MAEYRVTRTFVVDAENHKDAAKTVHRLLVGGPLPPELSYLVENGKPEESRTVTLPVEKTTS